jgi:hypothetical protein
MKTVSIGATMEQLGPSKVIGANVNWFSHFGNWKYSTAFGILITFK